MVTRVGLQEKGIPPHRVTRIVQVAKSHPQLKPDFCISKEEETYTMDQIKQYFNRDTIITLLGKSVNMFRQQNWRSLSTEHLALPHPTDAINLVPTFSRNKLRLNVH
jgi:hypothetical protein